MFDPVTPLNSDSQKIEIEYYETILNRTQGLTETYLELPIEIHSRPPSKMDLFQKAGLIGSLNESGVTSENYKKILYH